LAKTKADTAIQKHIDMIREFISTIQTRRGDLVKKMYELQKQDVEFEKLLQVALLRLLSAHELGPSSTTEKPKFKDSNAYQ
jgi:hypothetical protein